MERHWLAVDVSALTDDDHGLIVAACALIGCDHASEVAAASLRKWPRALRLDCPLCGKSWLLKRFSTDAVDLPERFARFAIERRNIEQLTSLGFNAGDERIPRADGFIGAPHFAVVEEYCDHGEFLEVILESIHRGKSDILYVALAQLAAFLARLHAVPVAPLESPPSVVEIPHLLDAVAGVAGDTLSDLARLADLWQAELRNQSHRFSLVHDGLTPVNVLYSADSRTLIITDFETVHVDSPFVDIGDVTAELKLSFALHSGNEYHAEPFIAFFLREYYSHARDLDLSFAEFTFCQTFFMGRRLLTIARGAWLGRQLQRWAIDAARVVWSTVNRRVALCRPHFDRVGCVLFDFYNTLVFVEDDEGDLNNFAEVRKILAFTTDRDEIPTAEWLRNKYFECIRVLYEESREPHPDVDLEAVWCAVLGGSRSGISVEALYRDERKLLHDILKTFRHTAVRTFDAFPGAIRAIQTLRQHGIKIGLISDAQWAYVDAEIQRAGISGLLDCLVVSAEFRYRKPDARLFARALDRVKVAAENAVFVGDDLFRDIYGAQQIGMRTVYKYSRYGAGFFGSCVPDAVIRHYDELVELILASGSNAR